MVRVLAVCVGGGASGTAVAAGTDEGPACRDGPVLPLRLLESLGGALGRLRGRDAVSIVDYLNALWMVDWDRCAGDPDGTVSVYGWMPRPDGNRDFVAVEFAEGNPERYVSSSAEWDKEIHSTLWPDDDMDLHSDCVPVPEVWPGVKIVANWQTTTKETEQ